MFRVKLKQTGFLCLDGIRGYLALLVFISHSQLTWALNKGGVWSDADYFLYSFGKVGVLCFFMITGFLFYRKCCTINSLEGWINLFISRVFRIYPAYLLSLCMIIAIVTVLHDIYVDTQLFKDIIKWLLFVGRGISDADDVRIVNASIAWTLKYEWLFYLSLPFLTAFFRKFRSVGLLAFAFFVFLLHLYPLNILNLFSTEYMLYFLLGAIIAVVTSDRTESHFIEYDHIYSCLLLFSFTGALVFSKLCFPLSVLLSFVSLFFVCNSVSLFGVLKSETSRALGEISYSIYLFHGIFLYLLVNRDVGLFSGVSDFQNFDTLITVLVGVVVLIFSSASYIYIEKKPIDIGRRLYLSKDKSVG